MAKKLCIEDIVVWHGRIPNPEVQQIMQDGDLFLFTSIMEGTPHVVLEAVQNALPVICFDACGQSGVVDNSIGIKIPMIDKQHAVNDFAMAILKLYQNPALLKQMSINCNQRQKELSWDNKAKIMIELYEKAIRDFEKK